jgi:hypothetical protein
MDRLYNYVEENKTGFKDGDYKLIVDAIMEQKNLNQKIKDNNKVLREKLHQLTNDYVRLNKIFLNLYVEREGYLVPNALPNINLDMEYEEYLNGIASSHS